MTLRQGPREDLLGITIMLVDETSDEQEALRAGSARHSACAAQANAHQVAVCASARGLSLDTDLEKQARTLARLLCTSQLICRASTSMQSTLRLHLHNPLPNSIGVRMHTSPRHCFTTQY